MSAQPLTELAKMAVQFARLEGNDVVIELPFRIKKETLEYLAKTQLGTELPDVEVVEDCGKTKIVLRGAAESFKQFLSNLGQHISNNVQ